LSFSLQVCVAAQFGQPEVISLSYCQNKANWVRLAQRGM